MGTQLNQHQRSRLPGMQTIERKIREMARKKGMLVLDCSWSMGGRSLHAAPYRLDIIIGSRIEKIYFTERELAQCAQASIDDATLVRLYRVLCRIHEEQVPFAISSLRDVMARVRP